MYFSPNPKLVTYEKWNTTKKSKQNFKTRKQAVKLTIKMFSLNIDLKFFKLSSEANFANLH